MALYEKESLGQDVATQTTVAESPEVSLSVEDPDLQWDLEEEKALVRR